LLALNIKANINMSSFSLYDATIPTAQNAFKSMTNILREGEKHANAESFPTARLAEDMNPLTYQVHIAAQLTEKMVARFTGREPTTFEDNLSSFAEMYERIEIVQKVLEAADKETVNQRADHVQATPLGPMNIDLSNTAYATAFTLPNLYFHLTTAYAILRKEGVPIGKRDYLMNFLAPHMPQAAGGN
jgi:hypothetical protein